MTDKITAKLLAGTLPAGLSAPSYDRNAVKSSIVHIGAGGFHRSHQQHYPGLFTAISREGARSPRARPIIFTF
jgi:hypothetical protein